MRDFTPKVFDKEIPYGYCLCGCGQKTNIVSMTNNKAGRIKGEPSRFITGHNDRYKHNTLEDALWSRVDIKGPDECWPWTSNLNHKGYGYFDFGGEHWLAHRAAWTVVNGPIPEGEWVLHKCNTPTCCNAAHHYLGDHQDNMDDMYGQGRNVSPQGERNGQARTTEQGVIEMRRLHRDEHMSINRIAEIYDFSTRWVHQIVNYKAWKHVP